MAQLTADEVDRFLTKIGISHGSDKSSEDKLSYLNQLMRAFNQHVVFTNLHLLATKKRGVQTWDLIKKSMLSMKGGLCHELNVFMCALLTSLGFQAHNGLAVVVEGELKDHVIVIVKNVCKDGDNYLVDVGFGKPTLNAFPLDFEKEGDVFTHNPIICKYVKEDGLYKRYEKEHGVRETPYGDSLEECWKLAYRFTLDLVPLSKIDEILHHNVYRLDSGFVIFQDELRAVICPSGGAYAFKITKDEMVVFEASSSDTKWTIRELSDLVKLKDFVTHFFPMLSWDTVAQVVKSIQNI